MRSIKTPNPTDKHVGSRVRIRRIMLGMSQEKLGNALGLTFQQVQKYEKGVNRIGASRLQQIAAVLDAPPSFFFEGAPTAMIVGHERVTVTAPIEHLSEFMLTHEGVKIAMAFHRLSARSRRAIVGLVLALAEADDDKAQAA